eukprot:gnl/Chilomastix_caulleri/2413.p3 GENE.gnl/Chilomastix_caulleri/2413~~gnl/Chilomastix_caulleri/2413.p3  ORF type:complete len:60 (-),score=4.31 gnl/Chilomastix_caulleri/2413:148-327(-)
MGIGSCIVGALDDGEVIDAIKTSFEEIGEDAKDAIPVAILPLGYPSADFMKRLATKTKT